jgi:hypothetical protein
MAMQPTTNSTDTRSSRRHWSPFVVLVLLLLLETGSTWCFVASVPSFSSRLRSGPSARTVGCSVRKDGPDAADSEADSRRAAYLRDREAREGKLLPNRVDMEHMFGEDKCPEYIDRWGGMHRQVAMEGPTRKALEMAVDSEWASDSWTETGTPTETEGTPTVSF